MFLDILLSSEDSCWATKWSPLLVSLYADSVTCVLLLLLLCRWSLFFCLFACSFLFPVINQGFIIWAVTYRLWKRSNKNTSITDVNICLSSQVFAEEPHYLHCVHFHFLSPAFLFFFAGEAFGSTFVCLSVLFFFPRLIRGLSSGLSLVDSKKIWIKHKWLTENWNPLF